MGVRRSDRALKDELDAILLRRRPQIEKILAEYGVPGSPGRAELSVRRALRRGARLSSSR
jgi:hypothetical protein